MELTEAENAGYNDDDVDNCNREGRNAFDASDDDGDDAQMLPRGLFS
jgi:hypothetical protein